MSVIWIRPYFLKGFIFAIEQESTAMNKLLLTLAAIVAFGCTACAQKKDNQSMETRKTLVAYFSAEGTTRRVAENLAQAAGAGGNVAAGAINTIPVSIYGVSGVTNAAAAHDGYEEETDDSLLDRLLFAVRQPATSGNVYHYIEWATSVAGVGAVKVIPLWDGNGTVKVIVVDANKDTPSEELLQEVRDVIDANAPIGATVTVVAPTLKTIDIAMKVTKGVGNEEAIKSVLTSYFKSNVFGTDYTNAETLNQSVTISYAQIGRIILDNSATTGVEDYAGMTINGGTENIVVQYDYMPVVGTVTLT